MTSETYEQLKRYETPQPGDVHSGRLVSLGYLELSHLNGDTQIYSITESGKEAYQEHSEANAAREIAARDQEKLRRRERNLTIFLAVPGFIAAVFAVLDFFYHL